MRSRSCCKSDALAPADGYGQCSELGRKERPFFLRERIYFFVTELHRVLVVYIERVRDLVLYRTTLRPSLFYVRGSRRHFGIAILFYSNAL